METSEIPLWPEDQTGPRRMCFLSGEARWYLWMKEGNSQAITSFRRDLLLLHQNGDLQLFRGSIPPAGTYITALHAGKMIRGRICPSQNVSERSKGSMHVCAIDVDEGIKLNLPLNQVRALPQEMKSLPCQAVRVDIGLDCIEQFEWPIQLNNMLIKAMGNALIFVEKKSKRPGSIPTIDADVTIVNPATGQSISIQKWLIDVFSQHLDLCGYDNYKPFPVGMSPDLMVKNMPIFQQPVLGFGMPGTSGPPVLPLPSPGIQAGMPMPLVPRCSLPFSAPARPMTPMLPHEGALNMAPGFPVSVPPPGSLISPLMSHCTSPPSNLSFPMPAAAGPTINATVCHFSVTQPTQLLRPAPPPPHSSTPMNAKQKDSSKSSTGLSDTSSVVFRSDCSVTSDSESASHSESSVGIDLNGSYETSSSVSAPNPNAPPFYPRENQLPSQSVKVVELRESDCSPTFSSKDKKVVKGGKSSVPGNSASGGKIRCVSEDSSSCLSAEAKPFVPKLIHKKTETKLDKTCSANMIGESAQEKCTNSSKVTKAAVEPNLKNEREPTHLHPPAVRPESQGSLLHPKGKDVHLQQIVRDWKVGQVVPAFMARVWNPSCFEVNVIDKLSGLLSSLQTEMNDYYKSHQLIKMSSKQQAKDLCGDFCACYDADEDLWLRVQVNEWFMDDSVTPLKVWAVDYGGYSQVDLSSVQPLMTEIACTAPVLVTLCSMKNIIPRHEYDIWPEVHLNRVKEIMPEDKQLFLRIDGVKSKDDIWPVSVFMDPDCSLQSINEILVAEGCAYYIGMAKESCDASVTSIYEDAEDPMAEAYELGGNNYDLDDEDACLAVSGRKVTDEVRICWFYQRNGYCYKKFCELRHERLDPDGHSTAKEPVHHDSFEKLNDDVLCPGSQVKLTITRIMTVNHFIATVSTKGTKIRSRETLKSMIENLNSTHMKRQLKTFTEFPADGEIVLFKDKTGMFYRGRVICADIVADDHYKVLNVDTGYKSKIPLRDLRRVDPAFLHHPFQAMECWLADVTPTQNDREWAKTCNAVFADLVKDQKLIATVVRSSPWGIEVNLMNSDGQDIAVILKEMDIVKSCPRRHLPLDQSHLLPG